MSSANQIAAQLKNIINTRTLTEAMGRSVLIVEGNAKREAPVRKGNLRRTITSKVEDGGRRGVVGTNAPYARFVHDGTGLYGPKGKKIVPTVKKALFWKGAKHPVRSVKGQRPNPFMRRAADMSRGPVERELAGYFDARLGGVK